MKVDWDRIIKEDHKPFRESRRLVGGFKEIEIPLNDKGLAIGMDEYMLLASAAGGPLSFGVGAAAYIGTKLYKYFTQPPKYTPEEIAEIERANSHEQQRKMYEYYGDLYRKTRQKKWKMMQDEAGRVLQEDFGYDVFATGPSRAAPSGSPAIEALKEKVELYETNKIMQENGQYLALMRNEKESASRAALLNSQSQKVISQNAAALQAAKRGATNAMGSATATMAAIAAASIQKAQHLKSMQELATQRQAVMKQEAEAAQAINAASAQNLAQQNAMREKIRAEALARQAAIDATKGTPAPRSFTKKVLAPQVKFGGKKKRKNKE